MPPTVLAVLAFGTMAAVCAALCALRRCCLRLCTSRRRGSGRGARYRERHRQQRGPQRRSGSYGRATDDPYDYELSERHPPSRVVTLDSDDDDDRAYGGGGRDDGPELAFVDARDHVELSWSNRSKSTGSLGGAPIAHTGSGARP